jgi:S-DNA-T family DNA segregation ATPase FtsK/SpoIIIE
VQTGFDPETGKPVFEDQPIDLTALPFIVVIIDEMADLMLVAGKEIEARSSAWRRWRVPPASTS